VKPRRVRFTDTTQQHVDREHAWWIQNREHRDAFATDLEAAIQVIAVLPGAGNRDSQHTDTLWNGTHQ